MWEGGREDIGIASRMVPVARDYREASAMDPSASGALGTAPLTEGARVSHAATTTASHTLTSLRPAWAVLSRLAGIGVLGVWLAAWPAASFALAEEATPVTSNAGVGTGEPAAARPLASRTPAMPAAASSAVPQEISRAPAEIAAPRPVATRGGIDAAGNGPVETAPAPATDAASATVAAPVKPAASAAVTPVRGGIDAAGNGNATAGNSAPAAPTPGTGAQPTTRVATVNPASAPADVTRPETPEVAPPIDAAPADIAPADLSPSDVEPTEGAAPGIPPAAPAAAQPPSGPLAPIALEIGTLLGTGPAAPAADPSITASPSLPAKPVAKPANAEEQALATFYGARQNMPVFVDETGYNARAKAVLHRLGAAGEDGLDAADYGVAKPASPATAATQARAEIALAKAALAYAHDAQAGRFNPIRISELVTPTREIPAPLSVLETLATAPNADTALAAYNPPHPGYKALKAKLAEAEGLTTPVVVAIPSGPLLRPGDDDPRVPTLRTRLGLTGLAGDFTYDPALVEAVKAFQETSGTTPDGVVGSATLAELNRNAGQGGGKVASDIIANMERWRWLPRDLGVKRVMVNIPEYLVRIFDGPQEVYETRIVVGKPETPTPLLSHEMEYVVVNPAWNIPPSIAKKEMMPLLRSNPSALARQGIEAKRNRDGSYSFRQPPGERNALGRIKFMFPNDHAVYLHDTPSRSLFANSRRAYSHGCMRVEDPLKFGEVVFQMGLPGDGWTEKRIGKMLGGSERYINLKDRLPVHVTYFTTVVDEHGKLRTFEDIYGINAQVKALLGLAGKNRVADSATTRKR